MINRRNLLTLAAGSLIIPSFSFAAEKQPKYQLIEIELERNVTKIPWSGMKNAIIPTKKLKWDREKVDAWLKDNWYDQTGYLYLFTFKNEPDTHLGLMSDERQFIDGEIIEGLKVGNIYIDKNFTDREPIWCEDSSKYIEWKNWKIKNKTPNDDYQRLLKNNFNWSEWESIIVFNYKDGIRYMTPFGRLKKYLSS